ncbi:MMPL family transporter [Paenibacillus cymbidii]|uniref:MMPL family transporter n=1 Tax=Paenibacillus cymbidii TaxID=1639034 RepID=UPI0010811249|nr:MMPL family transporter [Paenibacillus cymbidii]
MTRKRSHWLEKYGGLVAGPRTRWLTLAVWILLAGLLSSLAPSVNDEENNAAPNLPQDALSVQADALLQREFPNSAGVPALIVWYRSGGLADADYAAVQRLVKELQEQPLDAMTGVPPLDKQPLPALKAQAAKDGTTFVLPVSFGEQEQTETLKASLDDLKKRAAVILGADAFESGALEDNQLHARITGPVGIQTDATALFQNADVSLLLATVAIVLVLLILLYRSPLLAIVPLIGVGFAYGVIGPILGFLAHEGWIVVDSQGISIMTVLLFGAGTDYCLFLVARYRQELLTETDKYRAMRAAISGASGAVAMSGLTVVVSLLALLVAEYGSNHRFAIPFSLSILIMGLASLTLVPALLAIFGRASFFPFIPRTAEMRRTYAAAKGKPARELKPVGKPSLALGRLVTNRPWTVMLVCVVVLGGFAWQAASIKTTFNLLQSFPKDMASREGFALIGDHFTPGDLAPVKVIVDSGGKEAPVRQRLQELPFVAQVAEPVKGAHNASLLAYDVTLRIDPYSNEALAAIPSIRNAAEFALELPNADQRVWVGGQTATQRDTQQTSARDTRLVIPLVIGLIALLLLVYLRSVVAMLYLIATVVLSYFSALGAGWFVLHDLMGAEAIQGFIPLYSFVFLVALGEDYNIFMISGIWQKRRHMPLKDAIAQGVAETSSVITSAGLILAGTFAVLATLPIQVLVQFGVVTAIGVLLDTFVVRPFLVPAITTLLGKRAFWPGKAGETAAETSRG